MKSYVFTRVRSLTIGISLLALLGALFSFPLPGQAAEFPDRPITLIVSSPAGDSADVTARHLAKAAEPFLKQPITVLNKPGGGMTIGIAALVSAKPDGYTLGALLTSPLVTIPHFMKLTYHPLKDIQPIMQYGILNFAFSVIGDSPFKTFKEVIAFAREHPGVLTYGTVGPTTAQYLVVQEIAKEEKVELVHVPFKGGGEMLSAVLGRHITAAATFIPSPMVRANKIRLLALFGDQRLDDFPEIPLLRELGYKVKVPYFVGIGAPKGLPEPILKKLEDAFSKAMKDPAFIQGMKSIPMPIKYRNSSDFGQYLAEGYEAVGKYVEELRLKKN
ncbi:MAG: hypothetical protein A3G40_01905 [Deltaproteobacteria bacterium RIFCSPLOWO2_12_FULL_57_22]|nr:MAG: hypothetical protein A3G40_01905 [Deltaproteobacteria bacterium RIFCSPLOWO2_12_FULL_57_22]